jgi:hypothetical protein
MTMLIALTTTMTMATMRVVVVTTRMEVAAEKV